MSKSDGQPSKQLLSAFSIIRKTYAKPEAHELVNITPAQFLAKTQAEKMALYLIGLAIHKRALDNVFAHSDTDWVLINLRSGQVIMYGKKSHQPGESDIEHLLMIISEVCFLYERSLWAMLHSSRQIMFDA
ncbi:hypothetical protein GF391_03850|nr:hypothetical protein [Candidatus Uhrbacteria bacterium]